MNAAGGDDDGVDRCSLRGAEGDDSAAAGHGAADDQRRRHSILDRQSQLLRAPAYEYTVSSKNKTRNFGSYF